MPQLPNTLYTLLVQYHNLLYLQIHKLLALHPLFSQMDITHQPFLLIASTNSNTTYTLLV